MTASKKIAALVAGSALCFGAAAATSPAQAAAAQSHTVRITNNVDTGQHGPWAWLDYDRTTTITKTGDNTYRVVIRDQGTFTSIVGAKSPGDGVRIGSEVTGSFSGGYVAEVVSQTAPDTAGVDAARDFGCDVTGQCRNKTATADWAALYFTGEAQVREVSWGWSYVTECERWVDSVNRRDGDVTGLNCVAPAPPSAEQPTCKSPQGYLVIPEVAGVVYRVRHDGRLRKVEPGRYKADAGVYRVTAQAAEGYALSRSAIDAWDVEVQETPKACATPSATATPTEQPSQAVVSPKATAPVAEKATPTPSVTARQRVINGVVVPTKINTGGGATA